MSTEDEETEVLNLLDISRMPRDEKRRVETEAAAAAERAASEAPEDATSTSVFFERSWRRRSREGLSEIKASVDAMGAGPARPPAPEPPRPNLPLSAEERAAIERHLGRPLTAATLVHRTAKGPLVEISDDGAPRLLAVRPDGVKEFREVKDAESRTVPVRDGSQDPPPSKR